MTFPEPEDLCTRILKAYEVQSHQGWYLSLNYLSEDGPNRMLGYCCQGIIQLVRKNGAELQPSNDMNPGSFVRRHSEDTSRSRKDEDQQHPIAPQSHKDLTRKQLSALFSSTSLHQDPDQSLFQ